MAGMVYDSLNIELEKMNKIWFECNKHLTNEEMLEAGLIDECDLIWVNKLRSQNEISMG